MRDVPRIEIVLPSDPRLGLCWCDHHAGYEQPVDGPVYAVIGTQATDDQLTLLASRIGAASADLLLFRDAAEALADARQLRGES